jgi:hypothetical protein
LETSQLQLQSVCSDLLGQKYELGGDGTDRRIDCIHLVVTVQKAMGLPTVEVDRSWYALSRIGAARELLRRCDRIEGPAYDGDVVLMPQLSIGFGVVWNDGLLFLDKWMEQVAWCPLRSVGIDRFYRLRSISAA